MKAEDASSGHFVCAPNQSNCPLWCRPCKDNEKEKDAEKHTQQKQQERRDTQNAVGTLHGVEKAATPRVSGSAGNQLTSAFCCAFGKEAVAVYIALTCRPFCVAHWTRCAGQTLDSNWRNLCASGPRHVCNGSRLTRSCGHAIIGI